VPVAAVPMAIVLLVTTFTVHRSNGFSSIKHLSKRRRVQRWCASPDP
jgi:uncharacterized membrane protein YphA (DoxX/SURF4 family)